ncbi:hypothetical protein RSK20926_10754 [Roseobacter sp. SK209-2-6]|nr:hypothetical protein RSK20926_10754 [Roseobacter sp. SK209-2-6]
MSMAQKGKTDQWLFSLKTGVTADQNAADPLVAR